MAQRRTSTSRKKSSKPKKSSRPFSRAGGRSASTAPKSKNRVKKSTTKSNTAQNSSLTAFSSARATFESIPAERWLDIAGILVVLLGLLTLIALFSPVDSRLSNGWVSYLSMSFGWGKYILGIVLVVGGLWLVLRKFERIPRVTPERILGGILLFIAILTLIHFASMWWLDESAGNLAEGGAGGGNLGAAVSAGLENALGIGGAAIALLALLIIAIALTFDMTIAEMVAYISPLTSSLQRRFLDGWEQFRLRTARILRFRFLSPQGGQVKDVATTGQGGFESRVVSERGAGATPHGLSDADVILPPVWKLPSLDEILEKGGDLHYDRELDVQRGKVIEETLASFGAPARVVEINRGPTITQFGVEPDFIETRNSRTRVRVSKINALADDLALALSARRIRIQAPVPGKGFVGIEVPNEQKALVTLRDILESNAFKRIKSPLGFALGQNVSGNAVAADLAAMPHLLIAGTTGAGKSVCVNALICCLLMNNTPEDLRMIMVDPKRVELAGYNGIPHLLAPVVVELERVVTVLHWVTREMDMRYRKLAEFGSRNLQDYNRYQQANGGRRLPFLVVIIDELADLMMIAPDETERTITRLAQLARATGIHLVISTQRPSVDVVTGLIKANFPARIAFAVASSVDSRVILDQPGAERLLGRGDMLFQSPDAPAPIRLQGVFVSDMEIQRLVQYWQGFIGKETSASTAHSGVADATLPNLPLKQMPIWEELAIDENVDPLFEDAVDLCRREGRASISMLQRRLRIGYTRAARLIETMEEKGIVSVPTSSMSAREILDYGPTAPPDDEI